MDHRETSGRQNQELTGPILLRAARTDEAARLSGLATRSKGYWGYDRAFMEQCAEELTWSEADIAAGLIYVAETRDEVPLGFCDLRFTDGVLEVDALYVDPIAIGKGAGRVLWEKTEDVARVLEAETIALDADPHAVGFYEHMGLRIVGQAPSGSIAGRMLPRMEKSVSTSPAKKV